MVWELILKKIWLRNLLPVLVRQCEMVAKNRFLLNNQEVFKIFSQFQWYIINFDESEKWKIKSTSSFVGKVQNCCRKHFLLFEFKRKTAIIDLTSPIWCSRHFWKMFA